ncbi:hypothetical protein BD780_000041 [Clostridium tetanomorphum]|uniref:Uncharacterized protein n=1 Tax=Clostridium tetanomorphum TaxID=1553 RepID=A0A923IZ71_CLOTT|nr:hypothetical protein [Clostridium tetanomorphum]KAJ48810.1 hypothetical protein CTM_26502 [Clostridium tetanomorphum DSM 665]KAJ52067.1 hypothetical protein CTM_09851 [Clostridium tetanomorphum DSM 665]MBC2397076.1 hypothetical protein [Clostridium tetanomorphum]MBP1862987.1 hypothetical protein [Clostridium tetanomorphum]NRS82816.1 hypothetical protein [Clostridium tetanomorphum]
MNESNRKKVIAVVVAVIVIIGGALYFNKGSKNISSNGSNKNNTESVNNSNNNTEEKKQLTKEEKEQEEKNKIVQNEDLTKKIKNEKLLLDGQVYIQNDIVNCTMVAKKDVNPEEVKKLAQDYSKKLSAQFKGKKINVQAVQNRKSIADITINK